MLFFPLFFLGQVLIGVLSTSLPLCVFISASTSHSCECRSHLISLRSRPNTQLAARKPYPQPHYLKIRPGDKTKTDIYFLIYYFYYYNKAFSCRVEMTQVTDTNTQQRCQYPFPSAEPNSILLPRDSPPLFSRAGIIFLVTMIESQLLMAYFSFRLNQRDVLSGLTTSRYRHGWSTGSNLPVGTW